MAENFNPLQEEHLKEIHATHGRIQQWTTYMQDYDALHDRLQTLPDSITHNVMVPFGSKAFFHGELVHTNEVTVLLGDNWFVDRSAKQAREIIERRRTHLRRMIDDAGKVLADLQQRVNATAAFTTEKEEDIKEIREELVEEGRDVPHHTDRSSVVSDVERDQPISFHSPGGAAAPRSRRVAHTPKEVNGRVAHPPRRVFPVSSASSTSASSSTASECPSSNPATRKASGVSAAAAAAGDSTSFDELLVQLEKAEKSDAVPVAKQIKKSSDSTQSVKFEHSSAASASAEADTNSDAIRTPGDIYGQFVEKQKLRREHGQPSVLDERDADSSHHDAGYPEVDLAALSRLRLQRAEDSEDDDDDDDDDDNAGGDIDSNGNIEDAENTPKPVDLSRAPQRSSLRAKGRPSIVSRVRFSSEPQVKEFQKADSPGPKAPASIQETESVMGAVMERTPISTNETSKAASGPPMRMSIKRVSGGRAPPKMPSTAPPSDLVTTPPTRPQSKFKAARSASDA